MFTSYEPVPAFDMKRTLARLEEIEDHRLQQPARDLIEPLPHGAAALLREMAGAAMPAAERPWPTLFGVPLVFVSDLPTHKAYVIRGPSGRGPHSGIERIVVGEDPRGVLARLNALHATRLTMQYASVYQGTYEAEAIRLNERLHELTGHDYVDFPLAADGSRGVRPAR